MSAGVRMIANWLPVSIYNDFGGTVIAKLVKKLADEPLASAKHALGVSTLWVMHLPFIVQVAFVVFLIEFFQYSMHRTMHDSFLWWTHAPHHLSTQLNAMMASRRWIGSWGAGSQIGRSSIAPEHWNSRPAAASAGRNPLQVFHASKTRLFNSTLMPPVEAHGQIHGMHVFGDAAHRDVVHAGQRYFANVVAGDAAGRLQAQGTR